MDNEQIDGNRQKVQHQKSLKSAKPLKDLWLWRNFTPTKQHGIHTAHGVILDIPGSTLDVVMLLGD